MRKQKHIAVAGLLAFALFGTGVSGTAFAHGCGGHAEAKDIVDTAVEAGQFGTLVAAVKAAGLVDALKDDGPLTVFAPTDEAFAKLPAGTVESLLEPENRDRLVAILTYHVAPGRLTAEDVVAKDRIDTLNGQRPAIAARGGTVTIDGATILKTDIETSNGVIHVIDSVILPGEKEQVRADAMELIEMAISKGAPLYNNHRPAACTAVYEMAAESLVRMDGALEDSDRDTLRAAMDRVDETHDERRQAWIMRDALDAVYASMSAE
jgi:uncharacterized surface protein with fasciclin (FAS1) repeats